MGYRVLTKDDAEFAPAAALKALSRRVSKLEKALREEKPATEPELKPAEPQPAPEPEAEEPAAEAEAEPEEGTLPLEGTEDGQK